LGPPGTSPGLWVYVSRPFHRARILPAPPAFAPKAQLAYHRGNDSRNGKKEAPL